MSAPVVVHPWSEVGAHYDRLVAAGYVVTPFTLPEVAEFAAADGVHGWLRARGYDTASAEVVHFTADSHIGHRIVMLVGARRAVVTKEDE